MVHMYTYKLCGLYMQHIMSSCVQVYRPVLCGYCVRLATLIFTWPNWWIEWSCWSGLWILSNMNLYFFLNWCYNASPLTFKLKTVCFIWVTINVLNFCKLDMISLVSLVINVNCLDYLHKTSRLKSCLFWSLLVIKLIAFLIIVMWLLHSCMTSWMWQAQGLRNNLLLSAGLQ